MARQQQRIVLTHGLARDMLVQLAAAQARLASLRAENRAAEAALRKHKKRAAQDVESVISEYDTDLLAKEADYQVRERVMNVAP